MKIPAVFLALLLMIPIAISEDYRGVKITLYDDRFDIKQLLAILDKVPDEYLVGLKTIEWRADGQCGYLQWSVSEGKYFFGGNLIRLCSDELFEDNIAHELAHHRQYMRNEHTVFISSNNMINNTAAHEGNFPAYHAEILDYISPQSTGDKFKSVPIFREDILPEEIINSPLAPKENMSSFLSYLMAIIKWFISLPNQI